MPRRAFHELRRTADSDSTVSVHGSEYNSDAACPRVRQMGPSHRTLPARREITKSRSDSTLPLCVIAETEEASTNAQTPAYESKDLSLRQSISELESCWKLADERLRDVHDIVDGWHQMSPKRSSYEENRKRCEAAHTLQVEVEEAMDVNRRLRNKCCKLMYSFEKGEDRSRSDKRRLQAIEQRLLEMAVEIESTHKEIEREERKRLVIIEQCKNPRCRRRHHRR